MRPITSILTISFLFLFSFAAQARTLRDVVYARAGGMELTLDASIPDGAGPFPAAVLVHGGGWVAGDKQEYITYIFEPLSKAGFAWFSINYRLAPQYKFPAPADDVLQAIRYVRENARKYNIDPKRIALIGESAGGHLVSYVGARYPATGVAAVVSLYGIHDFITAAMEWKPFPHEVLDLIGIKQVNAETAPLLIKASPVIYVSKDSPPFLLIHGSKDEDVPYDQSVEMCDRMKEVGARCDLVTVPGAPHGMDHWEPHPEWHWYKKAMVNWLEKAMANGR
jgi:acetyl esterase